MWNSGNKGNRRSVDGATRLKRRVDAWRQWFGRIGSTLSLIAVAIGLPFLIYHSYLATISSPYFNIEQIEVSGCARADEQLLLQHAHTAPGVNIFGLDIEAARARLEAHPWVAAASVRRKLPHTLIIEITEHEPAAIVLGADGPTLVDARAHPIKVIGEHDPIDELLAVYPLISGPSPDQLGADEAARQHVRHCLDIWQLWRQRELGHMAEMSQFHIDPTLGVSMIVGPHGTEVRLGWGRWGERLERFATVYESLQEQGTEARYILVDGEESLDRVAVGAAPTTEWFKE